MSSYVPLSSELHKNKRWLRHPSLAFAKAENVTPIFANELVDAIHALPVAFVRHEEGFVLVAVMGLRPEENLLVSDKGKWLGNYTPLTYRARPFMLIEVPGNKDQQVLCAEEANVTDGDLGEPIFNENGEITEVVAEIFKLLSHYNVTRHLTQDICATLAEHGLIIPWELTVNDGVTEQPFNGLYRIDEAALSALCDEAFLALRKAAAFPVIYAQLLSMNNMATLSNLLMHKVREATVAQEPQTDGGTFSFAGL